VAPVGRSSAETCGNSDPLLKFPWLTNVDKLVQPNSFPTGWPQNCPPPDAGSVESTYYRIVKSNPPTDDDFRSYAELGLVRKGTDPCVLCGLSVYDTLEAAINARSNFPILGDQIARGSLTDDHGKMKKGRAHHWTWWPFENVARAALFKTMVEQ
jgi:hypothetical protein